MDMELANRLYVFCPDAEEGIEFIIQEIPEAVQKFSGSLREGQFLTSGYKPIKWDEKVITNVSSLFKTFSHCNAHSMIGLLKWK